MKILVVDPRCTDGSNIYYYTVGLTSGLAKNADVTLVPAWDFTVPQDADYRVRRLFYPVSQKLPRNRFRQAIRGLEYLFAYFCIWIMAIFGRYDVIHVEWPIIFSLDARIFALLKKCCRVFSLKAHNVLPHSTGTKLVETFRKIYAVPDVIAVHGEGMRKEFGEYFPESVSKVVIQKHGLYMNHDLSFDENKIGGDIRERITGCGRMYLFCGRIDADKGVDRLVKAWKDGMEGSSSLLVIAGAVHENYRNFVETERVIAACSNILYLPGYVEDNLLNYLIAKADLIVLPYRAGSMSGVAFTAAEFGKPVLSTRFGSIEEYIVDGETGFIVENSDEALAAYILKIEKEFSNCYLASVGDEMKKYFFANYGWDAIGCEYVSKLKCHAK